PAGSDRRVQVPHPPQDRRSRPDPVPERAAQHATARAGLGDAAPQRRGRYALPACARLTTGCTGRSAQPPSGPQGAPRVTRKSLGGEAGGPSFLITKSAVGGRDDGMGALDGDARPAETVPPNYALVPTARLCLAKLGTAPCGTPRSRPAGAGPSP